MYPFLRRKLGAQQPVFESGFPGFSGLTITSLVWVGRLLLNNAFNARPFADALRSGEKKGMKLSSTNDHCAKTKTFSAILKILKIRDSKPGVRGEFTLKPIGEKTRGIASLHYDILPPRGQV